MPWFVWLGLAGLFFSLMLFIAKVTDSDKVGSIVLLAFLWVFCLGAMTGNLLS